MKTRLLAILLVVLSLVLVLSACGKKDNTTTAATTTQAPTTTTTTPAPTTTTTVKTWTITFEGAEVDALTVVDGEAATAPVAPTRLGYEFAGWKSGTEAYNWANPVTADLTLTADWDLVNYTITYELNGGENHPDNPATYTIEDEIVFQAPTKAGSEFAGWDVAKIEAGSTGNKTVTATWTVAPTYVMDFERDDDIIYYLEEGTFEAPNDRTQTCKTPNGKGRSDAGIFINYADDSISYPEELVDLIKCTHSTPVIKEENGNHYLAFLVGPESPFNAQSVSKFDDFGIFSRYYLDRTAYNRGFTASKLSISFTFRMTNEFVSDTIIYARKPGSNNGRGQDRYALFSIGADGSIYYGFVHVGSAARTCYHDGSDYINEKKVIANTEIGEWHTVTLVMEERLTGDGYKVSIAVDGVVKAEDLVILTNMFFAGGGVSELTVVGGLTPGATIEESQHCEFHFDDIQIIELD